MRRRLTIVLALVVLVFVALRWWPRAAPSVARAALPRIAPPSSPAWAVRPPPAIAQLEAARKVDPSRCGLWMLADPALPMIVADSLVVSRFPRDSLPLTRHQVDQLQPNRRFDTRSPVTHADLTVEPHMQVLFTGDKFRIVGGESLLMTFALFKDDAPAPVTIVSATARAKAVDGSAVGLELPVSFGDRDDLVKMATLQLSGTPLERHAGRIDVEVQYDPGNGKLAEATLDAMYQPGGAAPARFTGQFREVLESGSLDVYVGVAVAEAGPYMIAANLYDASGQPAVSMLARMVELDAQSTEVKLQAFGRVIREANAPSPFTLTNLRGYLFHPGKDPDRSLMPDYPEDYRTAKYPLEAFSDAEYWDPHKQRQIQDLLDAAHSAPPGSQASLTIGAASAQGWRPPW